MEKVTSDKSSVAELSQLKLDSLYLKGIKVTLSKS